MTTQTLDDVSRRELPKSPDRVAPPGPVLTVAQVVRGIRQLVERQYPLPVWIEGEVSNVSFPASGHIYFSLVDERVTDRFGQRLVLPCAFFRRENSSLKFKLTDGLKALCLGQVTTYEGRGQYQLRVLRVEPKGIGALQLAFDQLKKRLAAEGLFDESRKRPIPRFPERVGIITSTSGSAVHDMIHQLAAWFHVILLPVKVQGEGAAGEIADAVALANDRQLADVLIVGRGGGSVEDLWAFNEEPLARALARSRIPVISAVGHQDDWTIADYVADLRASTPTDAAKLLVHERQVIVERARDLVGQLLEVVRQFLDHQTTDVGTLGHRLRLLHPVHQLTESIRRARELQFHLVRSAHHLLEQEQGRVEACVGRLQALSPLAVLARGYSITLRRPSGLVVTDAGTLAPDDALETRLARGRVMSTVVRVVPGQAEE